MFRSMFVMLCVALRPVFPPYLQEGLETNVLQRTVELFKHAVEHVRCRRWRYGTFEE